MCNLADTDTFLDFILLCETFLSERNSDLHQLPGYKLIQRCRKESIRGSVAKYVRDKIKHKIRDDLSIFCEGQFESLVVEVTSGHRNTTGYRNTNVSEMYRIPNTDKLCQYNDMKKL